MVSICSNLVFSAKAITALYRRGQNASPLDFYVPIIQAWTLCWMQLAPQCMSRVRYMDTGRIAIDQVYVVRPEGNVSNLQSV